MRVLMVCEGLNPSTIIAQPWKHVLEISKRMKSSGIDASLVSDGTKEAVREERISNIPVSYVRRKNLIFDIDILAKTINEKKPDVINWHCSDIWSSVYFRLLKGKVRDSIVWTLHSGIVDVDDLKRLSPTDYFQLYRYWNNFASSVVPKVLIRKWVADSTVRQIVTISERTACKMKEICADRIPVTAIPSGVDTSVFSPSGRMGDDSVLYFGPLSSFRGVDVLLSAFKTVRSSFSKARLTILARERDVRNIRRYESRLAENVHLINAVLSVQELKSFLDDAAIVALPFKFWPQVECPLTILEAMSMGKPVVSTPAGAIPEILADGETGMLVDPRNPTELARVILQMLNNPSFRIIVGGKARAYVERYHDWNKITSQTIDVLKDSDRG